MHKISTNAYRLILHAFLSHPPQDNERKIVVKILHIGRKQCLWFIDKLKMQTHILLCCKGDCGICEHQWQACCSLWYLTDIVGFLTTELPDSIGCNRKLVFLLYRWRKIWQILRTTSHEKIIWKRLKPVRIYMYPAAEVACKCSLHITHFLFTTDKRTAIRESSLLNWRTLNLFHRFYLWIELQKLPVHIRTRAGQIKASIKIPKQVPELMLFQL